MSVCRLFHGKVASSVITLALLMVAAAVERADAIEDWPPPPGVQPAIRLLSPPDGAMFDAPGSLSLLAGVKDPEGVVEAVEFHVGDRLLGTVRVSPVGMAETGDDLALGDREHAELGRVVLVEFAWDEPPPGLHGLWVLARNRAGPLAKSPVSRVTLWPADRVPVVTVVATQPVGSEGRPNADGQIEPVPVFFTIARTGPVSAPLTVFFALGGTAVNGVDYEELATSVMMPEGTMSVEVRVTPIEDDLVEGRETVVLRLIPPIVADLWEASEESYRVGRPAMAVGVILDNGAAENRPPRVLLLQPRRGEVFLGPAQIRLIAGAWDADGAVSQVEFLANDRSLGTVQVPEPEPGESIPRPARYGLDWSDVPAGGYVLTAVATDDRGSSTVSQPVRIQVLDRDRPPVVTVVATDPVATEPLAAWEDASSLDPAIFTVYRTGSTARPLTVFYRLGGTAENGVDYEQLPGRVQIPAGAHAMEVTVVPLADGMAEGDESVVLRLWPPHLLEEPANSGSHYLVGQPGVARATLRDADVAQNLAPRAKILRPVDGQTFVAPADVGVEVLTMDPDGYVARVELFAGDEMIGEEGLAFIQPPPPGQPYSFSFRWHDAPAGRHQLRVKATDDRGAERWSEPVRIAVLEPEVLPVVTVETVVPVAYRPGLLPVVEPAVFAVRRTGDLREPLTVRYQLRGTAENGIDYEKLSGEVEIPIGSPGARIRVVPLNNPEAVGEKGVIVVLEAPVCPAIHPPPPGCYMVGTPDKARAVILDRPVPRPSPPRVELVQPKPDALYQAPTEIVLVAQAFDADGWVKRVEFYANDKLIGRQEADPMRRHGPAERQGFRWLWAPVELGRYLLEARATDNDGLTAVSRPVAITVAQPHETPTVRIFASERPGMIPVVEGWGWTATFLVTRSGATGQPLTVYYRASGTAVSGRDYAELPGFITIAAGQRSARLVVRPLDLESEEHGRTLRVCLVPSPVMGPIEPYRVGEPGCAAAFMTEPTRPWGPLTRLPDGTVHAALPGDEGEVYRIEVSRGLDAWEPVADAVAVDGSVRFLDADAPGHSYRFYRLRPVVPEVLDEPTALPSLGSW